MSCSEDEHFESEVSCEENESGNDEMASGSAGKRRAAPKQKGTKAKKPKANAIDYRNFQGVAHLLQNGHVFAVPNGMSRTVMVMKEADLNDGGTGATDTYLTLEGIRNIMYPGQALTAVDPHKLIKDALTGNAILVESIDNNTKKQWGLTGDPKLSCGTVAFGKVMGAILLARSSVDTKEKLAQFTTITQMVTKVNAIQTLAKPGTLFLTTWTKLKEANNKFSMYNRSNDEERSNQLLKELEDIAKDVPRLREGINKVVKDKSGARDAVRLAKEGKSDEEILAHTGATNIKELFKGKHELHRKFLQAKAELYDKLKTEQVRKAELQAVAASTRTKADTTGKVLRRPSALKGIMDRVLTAFWKENESKCTMNRFLEMAADIYAKKLELEDVIEADRAKVRDACVQYEQLLRHSNDTKEKWEIIRRLSYGDLKIHEISEEKMTRADALRDKERFDARVAELVKEFATTGTLTYPNEGGVLKAGENVHGMEDLFGWLITMTINPAFIPAGYDKGKDLRRLFFRVFVDINQPTAENWFSALKKNQAVLTQEMIEDKMHDYFNNTRRSFPGTLKDLGFYFEYLNLEDTVLVEKIISNGMAAALRSPHDVFKNECVARIFAKDILFLLLNWTKNEFGENFDTFSAHFPDDECITFVLLGEDESSPGPSGAAPLENEGIAGQKQSIEILEIIDNAVHMPGVGDVFYRSTKTEVPGVGRAPAPAEDGGDAARAAPTEGQAKPTKKGLGKNREVSIIQKCVQIVKNAVVQLVQTAKWTTDPEKRGLTGGILSSVKEILGTDPSKFTFSADLLDSPEAGNEILRNFEETFMNRYEKDDLRTIFCTANDNDLGRLFFPRFAKLCIIHEAVGLVNGTRSVKFTIPRLLSVEAFHDVVMKEMDTPGSYAADILNGMRNSHEEEDEGEEEADEDESQGAGTD